MIHRYRIFLVAGEQSNKVYQDGGMGRERDGRASNQQIAVRNDCPPLALPGRPHEGPLRVQSVSAVQKVLGHRADGRLAPAGPDDQPHQRAESG